MPKEYEVVSNPQFRNLHVFLVHMLSRTPHIHRELEIGYILRGKIELRVGNKSSLLKPLDGYLINPLEPHEFHSRFENAVILAVQISPRIMESFLTRVPALHYSGGTALRQAINDGAEYNSMFRLCMDLARSYIAKRDGFEFECFALSADLLATLNKSVSPESLPDDTWKSLRRRMERMMEITDYIDQNCHRKLLLEELAEKEGLTMPHLSHLFRETLGMTFQDYLKKKRYEHARPLILGTDRNLLDISLESGFSDTRYMIQMFQDEFQCTPKQYRKKAGAVITRRDTAIIDAESILSVDEALALLNQVEKEIIG